MNTQTNPPVKTSDKAQLLGKITRTRALSKGGTERCYEYKVVRVVSRSGKSTTVSVGVPVVYALMVKFSVSIKQLTRVLLDASIILAQNEQPAGAWSSMVLARAETLLTALAPELVLAADNNSAWEQS